MCLAFATEGRGISVLPQLKYRMWKDSLLDVSLHVKYPGQCAHVPIVLERKRKSCMVYVFEGWNVSMPRLEQVSGADLLTSEPREASDIGNADAVCECR